MRPKCLVGTNNCARTGSCITGNETCALQPNAFTTTCQTYSAQYNFMQRGCYKSYARFRTCRGTPGRQQGYWEIYRTDVLLNDTGLKYLPLNQSVQVYDGDMFVLWQGTGRIAVVGESCSFEYRTSSIRSSSFSTFRYRHKLQVHVTKPSCLAIQHRFSQVCIMHKRYRFVISQYSACVVYRIFM